MTNIKTLAVVLLLAACYQPDLSRVRYTCDVAAPRCPDKQSCVAGCCGGPPCGAEASPDGGTQDPPTWDPNARPTSTPGCRSGTGYVLGPNAVACPAVLAAPGDITSMCGDGWELCPLNPLTVERCNTVPWGFFAASPRGMQLHVPPDESLVCSWSGPGSDANQRFLLGCGTTAKTPYDLPIPCGGFSRAVICNSGGAEAPTTWACPFGAVPGNEDFARVTQPNPTDGVLCCG